MTEAFPVIVLVISRSEAPEASSVPDGVAPLLLLPWPFAVSTPPSCFGCERPSALQSWADVLFSFRTPEKGRFLYYVACQGHAYPQVGRAASAAT